MAKGDLDRVLAGKPIYRHEDLKAVSQKWEGWATFLQFSSIAGLFVMIFILESVSKETARELVWYLAGALFLYGTVAFLVARVAHKHTMKYMNAEHKRVSEFTDEAIAKVKEK